MASKSYAWVVRNNQNETKNGQKTAVFRLFFDFRKNCPYDSNEILYSLFTLYYGPLCVIPSNSYCWDVKNIAKINPKMAKKQPKKNENHDSKKELTSAIKTFCR